MIALPVTWAGMGNSKGAFVASIAASITIVACIIFGLGLLCAQVIAHLIG